MTTKTTRIVSRTSFGGGMERRLDIVGGLCLVLMAVVALWAVAAPLVVGGVVDVVTVLSSLAGGLFAWCALRGLADLLRAQKAAAGMPFGGRMLEVRSIDACGACGVEVVAAQEGARCYNCGATFSNEVSEASVA